MTLINSKRGRLSSQSSNHTGMPQDMLDQLILNNHFLYTWIGLNIHCIDVDSVDCLTNHFHHIKKAGHTSQRENCRRSKQCTTKCDSN